MSKNKSIRGYKIKVYLKSGNILAFEQDNVRLVASLSTLGKNYKKYLEKGKPTNILLSIDSKIDNCSGCDKSYIGIDFREVESIIISEE